MTGAGEGVGARKAPFEIHAGFMPLIDCAPLIVARELGFDRAEGVALRLHREVSWANIRDKLEIGAFQCAHMLAPMALASALPIGRSREGVVVPQALNLNGDAITVSRALFAEMAELDAVSARAGGMAAARALAGVVRARKAAGREPLAFAMVFPFSCHNYDLRHWLAGAGIAPDEDVNLVVIPPPLLAGSLKSGRIDGFCVGAPWSSVAVAAGDGVIVATKSELWPKSPEKVLGVRASFANDHEDVLLALVRALARGAIWLEEDAHQDDAATLLARPEHVGVPRDLIRLILQGRMARGGGLAALDDPHFIVFHRGAAQRPSRVHAVWMLAQMARWGQVREPFCLSQVAGSVYRDDLYDRALGISEPSRRPPDLLGGPGFFGGDHFDAGDVMAELRRFGVPSAATDIERFAALNPRR